MSDMTDKEYDELDELLTKTTPKIDTSKPGFFTRKGFTMVSLDPLADAYIRTRAEIDHKTPSEVITLMVRREMARARP
jgi:hypothetical protein